VGPSAISEAFLFCGLTPTETVLDRVGFAPPFIGAPRGAICLVEGVAILSGGRGAGAAIDSVVNRTPFLVGSDVVDEGSISFSSFAPVATSLKRNLTFCTTSSPSVS